MWILELWLPVDLLADTTVVLEVLLLGSEATARATKIGRIAFEKCIVKAGSSSGGQSTVWDIWYGCLLRVGRDDSIETKLEGAELGYIDFVQQRDSWQS